MDTRMSKYRENNSNMSRVSRNTELYKEINNSDLDNFTVKSNATILGNQEQDIDIERLKKILDTKYKETAKRRSIRIEEDEEETSRVPESTTKEYDLNTFLAKARDDKEETYEEARAKKLRDTQFDILNNLNITKEDEPEEKETDEGLMELINTIAINEVKTSEKNNVSNEEKDEALELLSDLKGDENTEVYEGLKEEIKKIEETSKVLEKSLDDTVDRSFFTKESVFRKKDFLSDDDTDGKMSVWIKILLALLVIAFLVGLFLFLKTFIGF